MIEMPSSGIQGYMRRILLGVGLLVAGMWLVQPSSAATSQDERPAAPDGNERFVHVRFIDDQGRSVRTLRMEEIEASTQDGEPLEVTRLIPPDVPYDVGLVMDVSPSTEEDIDPIRQSTSDFVSFFPIESRLLVLSFANEVYVDCDWTTDRKKVDEAIWEYGLHKPGSKTILRDAIVASAEQMFFPHRPRTAMVLFTDGVDTGSDVYNERKTIEFLQGAGVLTYVIQYFSLKHYQIVYGRGTTGSPSDPGGLPPVTTGGGLGGILIGGSERAATDQRIRSMQDKAVSFMRRVGEAGGGGLFNLTGLDRMPDAYEQIASDLLDSYTIGFRPAKRSTHEAVRKVRIRTTRQGVLAQKIRPPGYAQ